uniref:Uncharacterized protein n=2 Tax=Anopheles atroparvus TaxID=41427 RepID=A0AAG5DMH9_ANOAO
MFNHIISYRRKKEKETWRNHSHRTSHGGPTFGAFLNCPKLVRMAERVPSVHKTR